MRRSVAGQVKRLGKNGQGEMAEEKLPRVNGWAAALMIGAADVVWYFVFILFSRQG